MHKQVHIYFILILSFIFCEHTNCFGQLVQDKKQRAVVVQDSNLHINLKEIKIKGHRRSKRKHYRSSRRYWRTVRNLQIVYPYAEMANQTINQLNEDLKQIHSKRERRKLIRQEYKGLMKAYKKPLMQLKISQGKLLMKLIDRETGSTSYYHLKELKGSTTAFFWQTIASMFGTSLKSEYEPEGQDWMIEEILERMKKGEIPPPRKLNLKLETEISGKNKK
ncbi:DUF4294 domain-containing protein [Ancylomarina salipaludis]|uniref:DUF4294 domain-containing protein n=1 Tax=Ancylomarina salipaludis TaxID=2501299 RepID=A0A4Q1JQK7_9BACT|nr:DUF4294 domain-containing protein [Ancylomarina salipaludis]RXQ97693.1 DUF4294 domain-containing protein [Ancylomarina salipaludis]